MFKIGADPEVFVRNKLGKYISAHGLVNGTKKEPTPVVNGAVQVDGMALEFNIAPATTEEEFFHNINTVKSQLHQMIGVDQFDLMAIPSVVFGKDVWEITPEEAKELGCDPDFNAWEDGEANPRPDNKTLMRTGAGHVHIGWGEDIDINDPDHMAACIAVVKQLDASVGQASVLWDGDVNRRHLYGRAGAFRPKSYGVEYRVMSNAWLNSEYLTKYVFNAVTHACNDLMNGNVYSNKDKCYLGEDYDFINNINFSRRRDAKDICHRLAHYYKFPMLKEV